MSTYTVIYKKEYRKLNKEKATIGCLMMLKNEKARLHVTLNSLIGKDNKPKVDAIIVYDTMSTDNTIEILKDFSEKHEINLYISQGEFVNFCISRNVSLDFADTVPVHYLLLLDCNDEVKENSENALRGLTETYLSKDENAFLLCQNWWSGKYDKYYNIRLVKNRCGWRYFGVVHEWIKDTTQEGPDPKFPVVKITDAILVLYQDRTKDDDKTGKRFTRDKALLLAEHKKFPQDSRTLFYLAQTCECLLQFEEALYYSKLRLELEGPLAGFQEERFSSFMRCGKASTFLGHDWHDIMPWYMKAFEHSERVEPLVEIINHYIFAKNWHTAYLFAHRACQLKYPDHAMLFVDNGHYEYTRWKLLGFCAFYLREFEEGKAAILKAIEARNFEADQLILKPYLEVEKKLEENSEKIEKKVTFFNEKKQTKKEFLDSKIISLKTQFPKLTTKQLHTKALELWKKAR